MAYAIAYTQHKANRKQKANRRMFAQCTTDGRQQSFHKQTHSRMHAPGLGAQPDDGSAQVCLSSCCTSLGLPSICLPWPYCRQTCLMPSASANSLAEEAKT